MILKENNNEEYVNVEDIDFIKQNEKSAELVDLKYIINGKQNNISIKLNSVDVPKLIKTYKDYVQKAIKSQNNICL